MSPEGSFNRLDGAPCPRCRKTHWIALIPTTGQVECPACKSVWRTVTEYIEAVEAAWGQQYDRQLRAIGASARATGCYR